jgi:hypothetical protein
VAAARVEADVLTGAPAADISTRWHAAADDPAIEHVERREQCGRAIALVVMPDLKSEQEWRSGQLMICPGTMGGFSDPVQ